MSDEITYCASGCTRWNAHLPSCANTDLHAPDCQRDDCRGCHAELCHGCEPRLAAVGVLCDRCHTRLVILLGDEGDRESIAGICAWLAENLGQHIRSKGGGATARSANPGEGFVDVMVALSDLQISLVEMAREFLECRGMRPLADTDPARVVDRLRPWISTLAAWEPIAEQIGHFVELRGKAHAVAPWRGKDRHCEGVPCPTCRRKTLTIPAGEIDVWCRSCGAIHGRETYDRITALVAWEAQAEQRIQTAELGDGDHGTLEELATVLGVPWGTLRRWKSLGWLPGSVDKRGRAEVYDAREAASIHEAPPSTPADPQEAQRGGSESQRRNLNAQTGSSGATGTLLCDCGHDIDRHIYDEGRAIDLCDDCPVNGCRLLPSDIARTLIDRAVKAERHKLAQELRELAPRVTGNRRTLEDLAGEWEAR